MAAHKQYQNYIFSERKPSQDFSEGTTQLLFNQSNYINSKSFSHLKKFSIWNTYFKQESARIYLVDEQGLGYSLPSSPFASLEVFEKVSDDVLTEFLSFLSDQFEAIKILHYPHFISYKFLVDEKVFLDARYIISAESIGHYLQVEDAFENLISKMELRKLRRSESEGFEVCNLGLDHFDEVFRFIEKCRTEKGQLLSLNYDDFKSLVEANDKAYLLFAVFKNNKMASASIAVRVSNEVLYHFYPATSLEFKRASPMVLLTKCLYNFCLRSGVKFLDLGTSMLNNLPNQSLIHFKEQLGGIAYQKSTFSKSNSR